MLTELANDLAFGVLALRERAERESLETRLAQIQRLEVTGRLAGGVAHDFNNILTAIIGFARFAKETVAADSPAIADIDQVLQAADRAAALTRQLLAFSRRQIMAPRVLDLNEIVQGLSKMLRRLIGEDIELITVLAPDLGRVQADPGHVEQVITNLVVNARDAMPEGGRLVIETANVTLDRQYAKRHPGSPPGRYVMLAVSDTGVGMTQEVKAHLFEPFFTTKEQGKGTGLGLSTVYGIVKQHGGAVWVYSEPGKGATFKIYLPRFESVEADELDHGRVVQPPRGVETVFVVEDDQGVRLALVRILEQLGYRVLQASNGPDALRQAQEHRGPIHLLLTDVVMPRMSGKRLSESFADIHPESKVMFMSGYTDNFIVHGGILDKDVAFLQKPFTLEGVASQVRQVLDK